MNLFTVTQCVYNPGGTDPNPIMTLRGTVNGIATAAGIFWAAIQQAFVSGGIPGVQAYLGPTLLNASAAYGPALPVPQFFAAKIPLPVMGQGQSYPEPTVVVCPEAMVPAWSA